VIRTQLSLLQNFKNNSNNFCFKNSDLMRELERPGKQSYNCGDEFKKDNEEALEKMVQKRKLKPGASLGDVVQNFNESLAKELELKSDTFWSDVFRESNENKAKNLKLPSDTCFAEPFQKENEKTIKEQALLRGFDPNITNLGNIFEDDCEKYNSGLKTLNWGICPEPTASPRITHPYKPQKKFKK